MSDAEVAVLIVPDDELDLQREPSADWDGVKCYASKAMADDDGLPVLYEGDFVVVDRRWPISDMNGLRIPGQYRAALLRALIAQAGGVEVEVEHRAPKRQFIGGEGAISDMLQEHAVFVDPISVARKVAAGPALLLPMEVSE